MLCFLLLIISISSKLFCIGTNFNPSSSTNVFPAFLVPEYNALMLFFNRSKTSSFILPSVWSTALTTAPFSRKELCRSISFFIKFNNFCPSFKSPLFVVAPSTDASKQTNISVISAFNGFPFNANL